MDVKTANAIAGISHKLNLIIEKLGITFESEQSYRERGEIKISKQIVIVEKGIWELDGLSNNNIAKIENVLCKLDGGNLNAGCGKWNN